VVDYAFSLPSSYKIDADQSKKILRDTFRDDLPGELFQRPKHGFEVPLLKWFRTGLRDLIEKDLLSDDFIRHQGVFDPAAIAKLRQQVFSSQPGESEARIWGLIVFQYWWKKYLSDKQSIVAAYA
jgi:asparagine synthase (glutamine-hydrolysing)